MDMFMLLAVIGVIYAFRSAIADVRTALSESTQARLNEAEKAAPGGKLSEAQRKAITRRHRASWWLREVAQGFPVLTAGWAAGWHAHRMAAAEAQADSAEQKLRTRELIRRHKARAAAAKAAIKTGTTGSFDDAAPRQAERPQPDQPASAEPPPPAAGNPADSTSPSPNGRKPAMPTGTASTIAAPEITYDQLQRKATETIARCEVRLQELRLEQWQQTVDQLTGALRDGKTAGNIQNVAEATEREIKELQQKIDTLQQFKSDLKHDHGGMNEAHQNAPVPGAHPQFYEG